MDGERLIDDPSESDPNDPRLSRPSDVGISSAEEKRQLTVHKVESLLYCIIRLEDRPSDTDAILVQ